MKRTSFVSTILIMSLAVPASYSQIVPKPESGFMSPTKYTNAFFGFLLPLPQDEHISPLGHRVHRPAYRHTLFGAANEKGNSVLFVLADDISAIPEKEPKKPIVALLALGAGRLTLKAVDPIHIGGQEFFRGEWKVDNIHRVVYTAEARGYVLYITILSDDNNSLRKFDQSIRGLTFFDPSRAKEKAGPENRPYAGPSKP